MTDAKRPSRSRRAFAAAALAGGALASAPADALDLVLYNDTDAPLACTVHGRYRLAGGAGFSVELINAWWPMLPGQKLDSLPLMLWHGAAAGPPGASAHFVDAALACRGKLGARAFRLHARLAQDDLFWHAWNGHAHACAPDPGARLSLHLMRFAPAGGDDGFALRGACWLDGGRGAYRIIEPLPVVFDAAHD